MLKSNDLFAGVAGTILQWYDFSLFGFLAPIIAKTFFGGENSFIALLNTFVVFAVGYLLSPLGAVFFGYIGDRHGRKVALTWSILLMTAPTLVIACLPGYQCWGWVSPMILLICRLIQGFVASAEFAGSALFLYEHAPANRQSFYACLTSSSYSLGMTLGAMVCSSLVSPSWPHWAWRLAFALAAVGAIIAFFVRSRARETPPFLQCNAVSQRSISAPIIQAWRNNKAAIIRVLALSCMIGVVTFSTYVFMSTYLVRTTTLSLTTAIRYVTYALILDAIIEPLFALMADRFGKRSVISVGCVLMLLCLPLLFSLMHIEHHRFALLALLLLSGLIALTFAPVNALMAGLFDPRYRFSGFATSFNVGISLFGGTTPLVMLWFIQHSHSIWPVCSYMMAACVIGLLALL